MRSNTSAHRGSTRRLDTTRLERDEDHGPHERTEQEPGCEIGAELFGHEPMIAPPPQPSDDDHADDPAGDQDAEHAPCLPDAILSSPYHWTVTADFQGTVEQRLARAAMRYTGARRTLIDILARAGRPLTLPEILDADAALAQSSAYRNLAELNDAGVVRRIVTGDEHARFELAEDLTGDHHHHFVCTSCGAVADVVLPDHLEQAIDDAGRAVATALGHEVCTHSLDLVGRCRDCV